MRAILLATVLSALSACMTAQSEPVEPKEREVSHGGLCSTDRAARFIGQRATSELGAEIRRATGARIFQWVPPDSVVTMDYRPDRVRVSYDRKMVITSVRCG